MLSTLISNPLDAFIYLIGIVFALTVHEYSHSWVATRSGDDTPRLMGRLNLNPASHIDPLGGLMFILLGFGWGKPVVYNPLRLRRRVDELLIALAGPVANLLSALVIRLVIVGLLALNFTGEQSIMFLRFLEIVATVNVYLAAFNLLPVPPLDGSSILAYFYPPFRGVFASQIGLMLILLLVLPVGGQNLLGTIMNPLISLLQSLTLG